MPGISIAFQKTIPVSEKSNTPPRNVLPDLIIPGMALAFAIYYLTTITEVPWIAQASAVLVSGLLLMSILAFAVRTTYRLKVGSEFISWHGLFPNRVLLAKRLCLLGLTIAYVWFLETLGFTLSTFFFLALAIMLLSSAANWKKSLTIALAASVIGYVVFIFVFETRFPKGPVERTIESLRDGS